MSVNESGVKLRITGWGAVSPAGWSADALRAAMDTGEPLPFTTEQREGNAPVRHQRKAPAVPQPLPAWMKHARMRRTTTIAKHSVHAAIQAIGEERMTLALSGQLRVGVIFCTMNGCVQFSRRFYAEVLNQPSLASPILFPETVYNAPSSHISTLLGTGEMNFTLVGDSAQFIGGIQLANQWLEDGLVDGCLVVTAEEQDWLSDEALLLFGSSCIPAEGAAAVYLERASSGIAVEKLTRIWTYGRTATQEQAAQRMASELLNEAVPDAVLCHGLGRASSRSDIPEARAIQSWNGAQATIRPILGEGFGVASGWQTVLACEWLVKGTYPQALISAVGLSQQTAGMVLSSS